MMISVVFQAGEVEKMVSVPVVDDRVLENPQSFSLHLSPLSTGVAVDDSPATITIEDNDGQCFIHLLQMTLEICLH